ncbi:MAG: hypothetical protein ACT6RN_27755, partial [Agrobacterium sp.]|uniref:hypothetical protein n=1 Tax=Agrobacterium sp. TaxID=361 RepID=UPI00403785EE
FPLMAPRDLMAHQRHAWWQLAQIPIPSPSVFALLHASHMQKAGLAKPCTASLNHLGEINTRNETLHEVGETLHEVRVDLEKVHALIETLH